MAVGAPPPRVSVSRLSDEVVQRLIAQIRAGALAPGTRLPPVRQLAAHLGVSQSTLREALRTLEAMGVISIRHGSGVYLRRGDPLNGVWSSRWMQWLLQHAPSVLEVLEVREAVEAQAASLAAVHATAADLRRLERVLAEGTALLAGRRSRPLDEGVLAAYARLDEAFHETLAQAARNDFLHSLLQGLAAAIVESREATLAIPGRIQRSMREHDAVFQAVRRRDPEGARRAMQAHVRRVVEEVRSLKGRGALRSGRRGG
ncbi:MAG: FadR/GntR family transcriptional regulator [Armatimonadota bacterium]|nr:FadR/GntR family transcriptional regulator [Armatimonadota bacterium]MDR7475479.1 FadR/GntR family transcriptional regulator [Armatimonadota bacterium]